MVTFHTTYNCSKDVMTIRLHADFADGDWSRLFDFFKKEMAKGCQNWELDLTEVQFFSSHSIGMVVVMNTSIMAVKGTMSILVVEHSHIFNQFRFSRIDQILNCVYYEAPGLSNSPEIN